MPGSSTTSSTPTAARGRLPRERGRCSRRSPRGRSASGWACSCRATRSATRRSCSRRRSPSTTSAAGGSSSGSGPGWHEDEHRRYGIDLPAPPERVDRFEEAVELISLLMSAGADDVRGPLLPARRCAPRAAPGPAAAHPDPHRRASTEDAADRGSLRRPVGHVRGRSRARRPRASTPSSPSRIAALDDACRAIGRDPAEIRRSTWATSEALRSTDAYLDFVRRHHRLGFTDFSTVRPEPSDDRRPPADRHRDHPRAARRPTARLSQDNRRPVVAGRPVGSRGDWCPTWRT